VKGQRFQLPRDCFQSQDAYERQSPWEVLHVSPSSARVRRLGSTYKQIHTADGGFAEFEAPDKGTHFSCNAAVEEVPEVG
jgi:hypothetical protein